MYDPDNKVMGYITKDGNVLSPLGMHLGLLKQGFLVNNDGQLIGRGSRDFLIRDNSFQVLGELNLKGELVNFDGQVLGTINAKGEINTNTGRFVAKAYPLQYYHAQSYMTKLYDADGRFIGFVDANGNVVDENGNVIGKLLDNGDVVDKDGNIIAQTANDRYVYDENGNIIGKVLADGTVVDMNGNVIGKVLPDGTVVDKDGKVIGKADVRD